MDADSLTRLARWYMSHDTGQSSTCIAHAFAGQSLRWSWKHDYPHDTGDLGRCLRLLAKVPEARAGLKALASLEGAHVWRELETVWDALTAQAALDGVIAHQGTFGNGPSKTAEMLDAAIKRGREAEKRPA